MRDSNFNKRLLIEQLRYMEAEQSLVCDTGKEPQSAAASRSVHDFETILWQRARCLAEQHGLHDVLVRSSKVAVYVSVGLALLVMILGVLGTGYAITDSSQTINIYWLLLILLGFNLISMLLWFVTITLNMRGLLAAWLSRFLHWLPGYLDRRFYAHSQHAEAAVSASGRQLSKRISLQADKAWLHCNFSGTVGKWRLGRISHQLWLLYLLAGLAYLVLLLSLRQYDFVWGTTLLSDSVFIRLTEMMSIPLDALGFTVPTVEQIEATRIGSGQALTAEYRNHWAQFLLGALLCFGILPRLILWLLSVLMHAYAKYHFTLDYYLPYYINLRQQLMPLASHGEIVDADTTPPVIPDTTAAASPLSSGQYDLPDGLYWVAVELGDDISWPPASISTDSVLGQIVDRDSMSRIQQKLQTLPKPPLAVAVSVVRPPDRGVKRIINTLLSITNERWLVLLHSDADENISNERLAAWYRLAEVCEVPANHVIRMHVE